MTESKTVSRATSIFLDLYNLSPEMCNLKLLERISRSFGNLPWENLTKFLKKHQNSWNSKEDNQAISSLWRETAQQSENSIFRLSNEVMDDHAGFGAGGTCFSLTNTLGDLVGELGYSAYPVMADMSHGRNIHCALLVEFGKTRYLLDPGYLVAEPVLLTAGKTTSVTIPGHTLEYRAVENSEEFELYTRNIRGEEAFRYRIRLNRIPEAEFFGYWRESFGCTGMNGLHLNMISDKGRMSANNLNLRVDSGTAKLNIKLKDIYSGRISEHFGINRQLVQKAYMEWKKQRCRKE